MDYQWQGDLVKVEFGSCRIRENIEQPFWWTNYNYKALGHLVIPAIRVTYHDQKFVIANQFGEGIEKLRRGGWPNFPHASLNDFDFVVDDLYKITRFDEDGYLIYKTQSDEWFEQEFGETEEWKRLQYLKEIALKKLTP